jgi:hypothetical protein
VQVWIVDINIRPVRLNSSAFAVQNKYMLSCAMLHYTRLRCVALCHFPFGCVHGEVNIKCRQQNWAHNSLIFEVELLYMNTIYRTL